MSALLKAEDKEQDSSFHGIFPNALEPSYLEETLIKLLKKSNAGIFREIRSFQQKFPDFYSEELLRFEEEVQFYISFLEFLEKTRAFGYPMETPQISWQNEFSGTGVYDLALLWKNASRAYVVVSNDFNWNGRPSFLW